MKSRTQPGAGACRRKPAKPTGKRTRNKQKITVFDFDRRWPEVLDAIDTPTVMRALDAKMKIWCDEMSETWDPQRGPWYYSRNSYWVDLATERAEQLPEYAALMSSPSDDEELDEETWDRSYEIESRYLPQPYTPDWYRCQTACHHLAAWNCAVGEEIMPERHWVIVHTPEHSNAVGFLGPDMNPDDIVIMDILWGHDHSPEELWNTVKNGTRCSLMTEIRRSERLWNRQVQSRNKAAQVGPKRAQVRKTMAV